jgi:flagellin-like hook-associated protein FlgL
VVQNLRKEEDQLELELQKIKEELDRLRNNTAFLNLRKLLDETKESLKDIEKVQLETEPEAQMKLWEILSMRVPKNKYMSIKLENYEKNNRRLEKLYRKKKVELHKYMASFDGSEQKRRFLENEIEALKKIEKLKDRFFYILMMESKNSKETYREKILKESLREKMIGGIY